MKLSQIIEEALAAFDETFPSGRHTSEIYARTELKAFLTSRLTLLAESFKELVPEEFPRGSFDKWDATMYANGRDDTRDKTLSNLNEFLGL